MARSPSAGSRRRRPSPRRVVRAGAPCATVGRSCRRVAGRFGLGGRGRARLAGRVGRASCRSSGRRGGRRFASLPAPCRTPPAVRAGRRARLAGSPRRWRCGCRGRCASSQGFLLVVVAVVVLQLVDQTRSGGELQVPSPVGTPVALSFRASTGVRTAAGAPGRTAGGGVCQQPCEQQACFAPHPRRELFYARAGQTHTLLDGRTTGCVGAGASHSAIGLSSPKPALTLADAVALACHQATSTLLPAVTQAPVCRR